MGCGGYIKLLVAREKLLQKANTESENLLLL
jgi:hypothetical protein